jgi:aldehyde dehydrogenase (NAD+)
MFAIGAANYVGFNGNSPPPDWPAASDTKTSEDYITLAKQLIPAVYDEADIDSIRAMAVMVRAASMPKPRFTSLTTA